MNAKSTVSHDGHGNHAVVIGSGIAGLLAAHVASEHFDRVTIIERDQMPGDHMGCRTGIPQGRHPHALLSRGLAILEEFFPGLTPELQEGGATMLNSGTDLAFYIFGKWRQPEFRSDTRVTSCSRPFLEGTVYKRIAANQKIEFITEAEVVGVCTDELRQRATGVRWRRRGDPGGQKEEIIADLVVDTSGIDSKVPTWLESLGYSPPTETVVDASPMYSTRLYKRPEKADQLAWKSIVMAPSTVTGKRGGVLFILEKNRWSVTLVGMMGERPPTSEDEYLEYARSLPDPRIYEAIKSAEPVTAPYGYQRTANRLRHYHQLPRYLDNLLVMGESVCSFNPMYAQGMSVAAMGSLVMRDCLRGQLQNGSSRDLAGLSRRFQTKLIKVINLPWQMSTSQDKQWLVADGAAKFSLPERLMGGYMERVVRTHLVDARVAEAFFHVQHMLSPPPILFKPSIALRVLLNKNGKSAPAA
ncbi:MAG: FAD-binding protein [Proteobacteria bacterium]|nr:FAD-binding protein [Pseudomonadota bacterium]